MVNKMENNAYAETSLKIRTKTSILTEKYPRNGVNQWSIPILQSQPNMGTARVDGLGKPLGDPPTYLDDSSVSEGTL
jgi:hypothetical protein